jgi:hypothetical protein
VQVVFRKWLKIMLIAFLRFVGHLGCIFVSGLDLAESLCAGAQVVVM